MATVTRREWKCYGTRREERVSYIKFFEPISLYASTINKAVWYLSIGIQHYYFLKQ